MNQKGISKFFYTYLLIKSQLNCNTYVYKFNLINSLNEIKKNTSKELSRFILSIIINQLINNYKSLDEFYDINYEKDINKIYEENNELKSIFFFKNEFKINHDLEDLYLEVILSLVKNNALKDLEFSKSILEQLDLQSMNLNQKIYNSLVNFFKDNKDQYFIKDYYLKDAKDLFDEKKINFYYILFTYIFKHPIYLYNIPFLLKNRKTILDIIKHQLDKFSCHTIHDKTIKKLEYVVKFFCDSEYYWTYYLGKKYLGTQYDQLKMVLKYYKNFLFESKRKDIVIIEEFIKNPKNNMDYEKYLIEYELAKKTNERAPIINFINEKITKNDTEKGINNIVQKWYSLEDIIYNNKLKKMRYDDRLIIEEYFKDDNNRNILLKIFPIEIYEFFIEQIGTIQKSKQPKNR